ncbi:MAG: NYN domain-containing protein [Bauldia sp.]|nr:NYN domain-containing protein [Bauldia sp.]
MADIDQTSNKKLALLIDADNVRATFLPIIIREASAIGTIVVRRVYGHFASATMASWQKVLHDYALTPVHVPPASRGKNASDMRLAIEAMDLLHQKNLQGICIASSDSDFTSLASRIREDGLEVIGFGEKKTTAPYVAACDRFFYCDLLLEQEKEKKTEKPEKTRKVAKPARPPLPTGEIYDAVEDASADDGWARLGTVGQVLIKRMPDFDPRNYGYRKLSDLFADLKGVESRRLESTNGSALLVRRRPSAKPSSA